MSLFRKAEASGGRQPPVPWRLGQERWIRTTNAKLSRIEKGDRGLTHPRSPIFPIIRGLWDSLSDNRTASLPDVQVENRPDVLQGGLSR